MLHKSLDLQKINIQLLYLDLTVLWKYPFILTIMAGFKQAGSLFPLPKFDSTWL